MWQLEYIFAMQLLLLCSVYVIYFQSNVVRDLEPQQMLMKPAPADRLVIFLINDLSAKSFFGNHCSNVADLSKIFLQLGQVGIIQTLGYNQCKSAEVALFSGCYKNPVNVFDYWLSLETLFNRSRLSYAVGSADDFKLPTKINVPIFAKESSVFAAVDSFLESKSQQWKKVNGVILIVHLSGLAKTNERQKYYDYIDYMQQGIWKTYNRFEQTFPDQRTAYLLISHPSTRACFVDPSQEKRESPFLLWGAGVSNTQSTPGRTFVADTERKRLPLNILQPIQMASLVTTLIGLPPPVNNRGQLAADLLNASDAYEANALFTNALQLVTLARHKLAQHSRGLLFSYMNKHWMNLQQLDKFVYSGKLLWLQQRLLTLQEYSSNIMPVLLQCIEYYENYYRRVLRWASALSYLGWQHYWRCQKVSAFRTDTPLLLVIKMLMHFLILMLLVFVVLQRVPWIISGFLLLPGCIWRLAISAQEKSAKLSSCLPLLCSLWCLTGFSDRRYISICYLAFACYQNLNIFKKLSLESFVWIMLVCALTSLSWLPPSLGYYNRVAFTLSIVLTLLQPTAFFGHSRPHRRNLLCNCSIALLAIIHVWSSSRPRFLHLIARAYVSYVFYPGSGHHSGIHLVLYNLSTLYTLLSTSYEALIIQLLALELQLALKLKNSITQKQTIALYISMYTFYSFFIIGNVADVAKFHSLMEITGFGFYSTLINSLVIAMKLCVPILLMICVIFAKCETLWTDRQDIFYSFLAMCNGMAVICLFRLRDSGCLWEIGVRFIPFITVQLLPFIFLLLIGLANLLLGTNNSQTLVIPKWN